MSNSLRPSPVERRLRELCLLALTVVAAAGCTGGYTLRSTAPSSATAGIAWHSPARDADAVVLARWRAAVGSPLVWAPAAEPQAEPVAGLTVVSWNVALDGGDVVRLVRETRASAPERPLILLLQEAYRSGDDIPPTPLEAAYASFLGGSNREREIDDVARTLGFFLYYVPSMRNGAPGQFHQDRGNAILSSVPLRDLTAIELPFERQRRVAIAATVGGTRPDGSPWSLRVANVHLDNRGGLKRAWFGSQFARVRQARGLREAVRTEGPIVLAGDFNTWFGFSDQAYLETAREFPETRVIDRRRTFRGLLRLDHVFYRLASGWRAEVRRADSTAGSDHHPLITTITF